MKSAVLFDMPTLPRGVISLSLPTVAACLRPYLNVRIVDLNYYPASEHRTLLEKAEPMALCGLRVSAQNLPFAIEFTRLVRELHPSSKIVWGGEFTTLMPEESLKYADGVVRGRFEPLARSLVNDMENGGLRRIYESDQSAYPDTPVIPALDLIENPQDYLRFMGWPFEASLGCRQRCTFCLVHLVQKRAELRPADAMAADLQANRREFINVVDYNICNDKKQLLALADAIKGSSASGWMGEMCLESLDDDDVLQALSESRCRIIYSGLESLSPGSLKTVNKTQNVVSEYGRIIRKAQSFGIQVACGFILGLEGTTEASFREFVDFCEEVGIIYVKLTFLTFNPGTKVKTAMSAKGKYVTEEIMRYDGNHLTFLPHGLSEEVIFNGARELIDRFYSFRSYWRRSRHLARDPVKRAEFILFGHCYGQTYKEWLENDILRLDGGKFDKMLQTAMQKNFRLKLAEGVLCMIRGQWAH